MTPVVFRNRAAGCLWAFITVWLAMLSLFTWVMFRDSLWPPDSLLAPGTIIPFFWLIGVAVAVHVANQALTTVSVQSRTGMSLERRYPFRVIRQFIDVGRIGRAAVAQERDNDGDPHFHARVTIVGDDPVDLVSSSDRVTCQEACERFNAALFGN